MASGSTVRCARKRALYNRRAKDRWADSEEASFIEGRSGLERRAAAGVDEADGEAADADAEAAGVAVASVVNAACPLGAIARAACIGAVRTAMRVAADRRASMAGERESPAVAHNTNSHR